MSEPMPVTALYTPSLQPALSDVVSANAAVKSNVVLMPIAIPLRRPAIASSTREVVIARRTNPDTSSTPAVVRRGSVRLSTRGKISMTTDAPTRPRSATARTRVPACVA